MPSLSSHDSLIGQVHSRFYSKQRQLVRSAVKFSLRLPSQITPLRPVILLWNLNICIENVDAKCWLAQMTLDMTSLPLAHIFLCSCFTFALRCFAPIAGNLTAQKYISTNLPNISVWLGSGVKKSDMKSDVTSTIKENTTLHESEKDWTGLLPVQSFPLWHCKVGYTDIGQVSAPQFSAV